MDQPISFHAIVFSSFRGCQSHLLRFEHPNEVIRGMCFALNNFKVSAAVERINDWNWRCAEIVGLNLTVGRGIVFSEIFGPKTLL
jgi:hypothetical protein